MTDAPVHCPSVVEVLVTEPELRPLTGFDGYRWRYCVAFGIDAMAEAVRVFVHAIEAEGHLVIDALAEVGREALGPKTSPLDGDLPGRVELRLFRDAIDDASAAPAAER